LVKFCIVLFFDNLLEKRDQIQLNDGLEWSADCCSNKDSPVVFDTREEKTLWLVLMSIRVDFPTVDYVGNGD